MNEKSKELAYAIAKGTVGSIPAVGGVLSELFGVVFAAPATKRRDQILLDMDNRLKKLEEEGFDIGKLAESDEFLTIAMQAYHIAMRTHQIEKRQALMNAIYNTPKLSIDENIKLMYLSYIDDFNEWHLKILHFLDNPPSYFTEDNKPSLYMAGKWAILQRAFPELASKRPFVDRIITDLHNRGLISVDSIHVVLTEQGIWNPATSEFGRQFLKFISEG